MTSDRWQYMCLITGCLIATLPLEFVIGARVYRQGRRALWAIVPVLAVFGVWDWIAISRGDWWFAARYMSGVRVGVVPIEEIAFFVAIPLCALLTFEAVRCVLARIASDA
ncbi:MAG TPA: lycopene cyclase domain-containing protein [Acidimicrobiales bacterium]|jgi:lycopene cyclase domain-containing protein|nr:lycopene cyclase domain-containing protein [Acidimicrobiales bacterium]